jgi:multiple sugar transport system substrate-binding protein
MSSKSMGWLSHLLSMGLVIVLLAACAGQPTAIPTAIPVPAIEARQPVAEEPRTTVRFAVSDVELPIYEPLIAAFEQENPKLHVQVASINEVLGLGALANTQVPEDWEQRLVAAADVVGFSVSRKTVEQGLVRDLAPLIEADASFDAADFYPGSLESFQWAGGTWALPTAVNFRLIFYSKDAFDAAGVSYPAAGWSWDDLLAKAKATTERQGEQVTRWGLVWPQDLAYRLVESRAGGVVDYAAEPPRPRFDDPKVIEALNWYADLRLQEQVMPYSGSHTDQDAATMSEEETLIDKGKAAMWPDFALLWWYRKIQGNVGVAPFPVDSDATGSTGKTTPAWTNCLAMSAGTTQPDAAWRWMVFLSRQTVKGVGQGMKYLPARRSAAEAGGFWDGLDEELATTLRYAMEHGYVAREPVASDAFEEALHAVLGEESTAEDALANAQTRAMAQVQSAGQEGALVTPAPTFVVAPARPEAPTGAAVTRITFIPGLGSFNLEPYRRLAERFQEDHPGIAVEVKMLDITGAGGAAPDLKSLAKSADCFQWYPSLRDPANREAILSLEAFLEADQQVKRGDFYPQLVKQFEEQGQLWGLPADVTPFVIEYNKDLFDAAGLSYPTPDWTWEQFLEMAIALSSGEGEARQYGFVAEVYESSDLLLMLERLGAHLIDENPTPPALTLDDPTVVEALRWYADLTTEHGAKPAFITDIGKLAGASAMYMEREGLINKSKAAMWTNSGTTAALFGPRQGLKIGVAPLPARADGASRASMLTTSGYFISASTDKGQACWQWLTFLGQQPEAAIGLPARRSLAESQAYREQVGEDRAAAYLSCVEDAAEPSSFDVLSREDWLGGGLFWLTQAYGKVLEKKSGVEEALNEAQKLADRYRACMVAAGDYGQKTYEGCLKQTDPSLPAFLFSQ